MNHCWMPLVPVVVLLLTASAAAQRPKGEPAREEVSIAGTLKQITPAAIGVVTEAGEQWVVQLDGRPRERKLSFVGKAEPSFLRTGMLVQLEGSVNKRGQVQEKVSQITVTSLREGVEVGIYPEGQRSRAGNLFSDDPEDSKKKKPAPKPDAVPCRITGYVAKISRTGELTITCGNQAVKADLADDANVSVDLSNLSLAQPGDKVELRGWHPKGQKGRVWSRDISVSAAKMLGETKKKTKEEEREAERTKGAKPKADEPAKDE
jgi:hypothetical protein